MNPCFEIQKQLQKNACGRRKSKKAKSMIIYNDELPLEKEHKISINQTLNNTRNFEVDSIQPIKTPKKGRASYYNYI